MAKRRLFRRRTWLNPDPRLHAALWGHVELELHGFRDNSSIDAGISFADCTRSVALEFDAYTPSQDEIDRLRKKAHKLRDFVVAWATAYDKALDALEAKLEDE